MLKLYEHFCPNCLELTRFKEIHKDETFNIRKEKIEVVSRYLFCENCNEDISDPKNPDENFIRAYDKYRKMKGFLQPHEIMEIRKSLGISQEQLSNLLKCSKETVSRYETGALQSEEHNNRLLLIKNNLIDKGEVNMNKN
ncbi:helix-turn-helix domain-containing protein [Clostridium sporogenes]|nr:helix-turn-helix domain-containing protein [Clostridium sporogenes]